MTRAWAVLLAVSLSALGSSSARASEPPAPLLSLALEDGQPSEPPRSDVLTLDEVLDSMLGLDPRLDAAQRSIESADGKLLAARGGFDSKLALRGLVQPLSYYQHGLIDVRVEQPTPLWGLGVWAGWRLGVGEFPIYEGKLQTASGGELRAGVTLPLWQGGPIDQTRADIRQAELGRERAQLQLDAKTLELQAEAAEAYWLWVAAGLNLQIERSLLELARERDAGLQRQIELGAIEAIVGADNRRLVLSREARVVTAEREFQAASLELSLFLRDAAGEPIIAGVDRLPARMPEPTPPAAIDLEAAIATAVERRPDLAATQTTREQAEVELRLATNLRSPSIDLSVWTAKDLGVGPVELMPVEVAGALEVEIPIPLRKARGRMQTARAELGRVDAELRFARDRIAVDVRDAHAAVVAAFERARLAGEQVDLAEALARAELRRFNLGAGDLLLVNLRELATATAAHEQVDALAAYFVAAARLRVAMGQSVHSVYDGSRP
ncbi:MAG TPA: TolC family protein [Enhygromyxa sp.]|nr:TolC family protein [Enhygromyxa sp.]